MKKIIIGFFVVTLLSNNNFLKIEIINRDTITQNQIMIITSNIEPIDIDRRMEKINKNYRNINFLLKKTNDIAEQIQINMALKASKKNIMSEEQITSYRDFSDAYISEYNNIKQSLYEIDQKTNLKKIQKEIMKEDLDLNRVYKDLLNLSYNQNIMINSINNMFCKGEKVLAVL